MSALAIAYAPVETFHVSTNLVPQEERRYCPVFKTQGPPTQYPEQHEPKPALVAKDTLYNQYTNEAPVTYDRSMPRRVDRNVDVGVSPQEDDDLRDLLEYITDVIPEFKSEHTSDAVAFHDVTEKKLPTEYHDFGTIIVWNDDYVPINHPARLHCGEGPFLVVRDNMSYMEITFSPHYVRAYNSKYLRGNKIVIQSITDNNVMIVHVGYFNKIDLDLETN